MKYILDERLLLEEDSGDDVSDLSSKSTPETEVATTSSAADATDTNAAINFELEFANAKTPEALTKVWNKFYKTVFKEHEKIIRDKFHVALAVYLPKYGWTTAENAILNWLVKGLANNPELFTTANSGYDSNFLMLLDKALANSWLGTGELAQIGNGVSEKFGSYDILFHPDFIDLSSGNQAEWLKFRSTVKKEQNCKLIFAYSSLLQARAEDLLKEKEAVDGQDINKISPEKINLLLSKVKAKGPLVDIAKAKTRFSSFTGKDLSAKPEADDKLIKAIVDALKDIKSVRQTFIVAYDVLPILNDKCLGSLQDAEKKALMTYRDTLEGVTSKQFNTAKELLKLGKITYSAKQVDELLCAIAAKDPSAKMPATTGKS